MTAAKSMVASAKKDLYCAVSHRVVYGDSCCYVYLPASGEVVEVEAHDLALLQHCVIPRTLGAHAQAITSARPALFPLVSGRLDELVRRKLLAKAGSGVPSRERGLARPKLSFVGVPTADRPALLRRCLDSIAGAPNRRELRVVVADGSRSEMHQVENRAVVGAVRQSAPWLTLEYFGRAEAGAFLHDLIPPPERASLAPALLPGSIGGSRNLLMLLAAGEPILMVDDDVILRPVRQPGASAPGIAITGCDDSRRVLFRGERSEAITATQPANVDVFRDFESWLGTTLLQATRDACGSTPCIHFQQALADRPGEHVCRLVHAGIAGDCATDPVFAWGTDAVRAAMAADPAQLRAAAESGNGLRIAERPTLAHGLACMAYCVALDGRDLLPPFLPEVRNEDGLFGAMIEALVPTTISAHLPWGVTHDPPGRRGTVPVEDGWRPYTADFVFHLLRPLAGLGRLGGLAESIAGVGECLLRVADAPDADLRDSFVDLSLSSLRRYLSRISEWQEALIVSGIPIHELRKAVIRSTAGSFAEPPRDLAYSPYGASWDGFRNLLRDFGLLLAKWPSVWASAQAARAAGQARHGVDRGRLAVGAGDRV